jgi:cytochrome c553
MRVSSWFLVCVALALPPLALAASTARSEYNAAIRSKPDLDRGEKLFENCATCHGPTGGGAPDGSIPRIAGQHFKVIVKQLVDYRHGKRWDPRMERYAARHLLPDAQALADVAAFISQQDRLTPRGVGTGAHARHGVHVYAAQCAFCHGPGGEGDERELVPRVAGQHYEYLLRQMYDAVDGRRPNFSRSHVRLLGKLERDDILGLADALSRADWTKQPPLDDPP